MEALVREQNDGMRVSHEANRLWRALDGLKYDLRLPLELRIEVWNTLYPEGDPRHGIDQYPAIDGETNRPNDQDLDR